MSTVTSTDTAQAVPADYTPTLIKINLVCEDRDTGKKCLFKDLKITLLPDQTFKVNDLIEKNISLQCFLNNCMLFSSTNDEMDVMIGFYPSEEIQNQFITFEPKTNIILKFEKIRSSSSESKKEENLPVQSNQNQISNNNNTNNINNNNNNQKNNISESILAPSNNFKQLTNVQAVNSDCPSPVPQSIIQNENTAIENETQKIQDDIVNATQNTKAPLNTEATASQLSQEDLNNNDSLTMSSHSLIMESEICSQQAEAGAATTTVASANQNSSTNNQRLQRNGLSAFSNVDGCENTQKGIQLNRKRRVSETLDNCSDSCSGAQNESKECSPITSFTDNECPKMKKQQSSITNDPTASDCGETNNYFTNSINLSLNGKIPMNLSSSNFQTYNSLLNNSSFSNAVGNGIQNNESNGLPNMTNQLSASGSSNGGNANNSINNNMSRQSRNKERTIREAIEMVTKWRDLQEDYRQKHQVKGLQEVADELNISKKVLDYYFQELRTAEFFGFNFDGNLGNKMGVLRKYIDEQKKNHELKNKNFKITRNLQFKYRLKDYQGSSCLSSYSSNINNNDVLSSTSSQKSKEKLQQKNQAKIDQITNLLTSSIQSGLVNDEMSIESENNLNFSNTNISGGNQTNSYFQNSSSTAQNQNIQDILSKNSPMFLQFLNNSNNTQNSNTSTANNSFSSISSGNGFNLSSSNNNQQSNINYLSSFNNGNSGFSVNNSISEGLRKQQSQPIQSNQNSMDKMLLELLLNQQIQQQPLPQKAKQESICNDKMNTANQMESLLNLFKFFQTNEDINNDLSLPTFQKSHSAQSAIINKKFDNDQVTKQQKLVKPQKIAVIQIRKSDE